MPVLREFDSSNKITLLRRNNAKNVDNHLRLRTIKLINIHEKYED